MDATPASAPVENTTSAPSTSTTLAPPSADYNRGVSPIKAQYLLPVVVPAPKPETLAHLSEAIESQGDEGRIDGDDKNDEANKNNKRDRKDVSALGNLNLDLYSRSVIRLFS